MSDTRVVQEVARVLQAEFRHLGHEFWGGCHACHIPAPVEGVSFRVHEPIETCHPTSGEGLEEPGNCLPAGDYTLEWVEPKKPGTLSRSHWLKLRRFGTGQFVRLCYGYSSRDCMDWRGITSIQPTT